MELILFPSFQKSADHSNHIDAMLEDKEGDISRVVISLFWAHDNLSKFELSHFYD